MYTCIAWLALSTIAAAAPAPAIESVSTEKQPHHDQLPQHRLTNIRAHTAGPALSATTAAASAAVIESTNSEHAAYFREALGGPLLPVSSRPQAAVILATERCVACALVQ